MKRCPSCQQVFPDQSPDLCPYDGTHLVSDAQQQPYYAGSQPYAGGQPYGGGQPPYGAPGDPSQWQPPGAGYSQPSGQYPPPYGGPYAPRAAASGLSKAALITGISALGSFILAVILAVIGASSGMSTLRDMAPIIGILGILSLLAGLTSVILGIVVLSSANKNPAMSKVHGILGIIFGAIPVLLWFVGLASGGRRF